MLQPDKGVRHRRWCQFPPDRAASFPCNSGIDCRQRPATRLRTAGVPLETRKALLGHKTGDITSHYSASKLSELIRAANAVLKAQESTLLRE
jgi:hypothetical protein